MGLLKCLWHLESLFNELLFSIVNKTTATKYKSIWKNTNGFKTNTTDEHFMLDSRSENKTIRTENPKSPLKSTGTAGVQHI